tara:strand:- start:6301 stop:6627 length:327 start_codon:yes stop_codon:yes gene_type:complete
MKKAKRLDLHLFVCTNERPAGHPRGCCMSKGSLDLVKAFKMKLATLKLDIEIRAQRSGCLDVCEYGPAAVLYPEGVWYGPLTSSDVDEICESHIRDGKIVQRLLIPGK